MALVKHRAFAAAVIQGKCPYLAKVVPELKPFVEHAEKGFSTLADCGHFAGLVDKLGGHHHKTISINGEALSHETALAACEKLGFRGAELSEAFKDGEGFLLHGYGYSKSDSMMRTHVLVKALDHGNIAITTESSEATLTTDLDVAAKAKLEGTQLVLDAVGKFRSDCDAFGDMLDDNVELSGGKFHEEHSARSKDDAVEACKKVKAKMDGIETLNFQELMHAIPGVASKGMDIMTVILEKTSQVKYSKRIMTAPIAIDIEYKDGKIHRLTHYMTEARGLVQKYGDRYAGHVEHDHDEKPFMRHRFWEKKDGDAVEASPECSKFIAKGPMAVRGCEMCASRAQPIEECMTCGGKCIRSACSLSDDPANMKECFIEVMKDEQKKASVKGCYKKCMDTDEPVAPKMIEHVKESEFHKDPAASVKFSSYPDHLDLDALLHVEALEFDVHATTAEQQP